MTSILASGSNLAAVVGEDWTSVPITAFSPSLPERFCLQVRISWLFAVIGILQRSQCTPLSSPHGQVFRMRQRRTSINRP